MHMADALVSPAVGASMWAVSAGLIAHASRRMQRSFDEHRVPLMGVLGAFVFAAQMINFAIPATGSSGHIGGGLLLAILLGPHAGFITLAAILTLQALLFADGGLLALGCNIFNLGFFPCYMAYPLVYRPLARGGRAPARIGFASVAGAVIALQAGAFCVVLQTTASGITALPLPAFAALMQPIHLAIGLVEGVATAAIVGFITRARPEALNVSEMMPARAGRLPMRAAVGLLIAAALTAGVFVWFASQRPDGLEWAVQGTAGVEAPEGPQSGTHRGLAALQERIAVLPDYDLPAADAEMDSASWPAVNPGASVAGLVGGGVCLLLCGLVGRMLRRRATAV